jgi:hypothetical protein
VVFLAGLLLVLSDLLHVQAPRRILRLELHAQRRKGIRRGYSREADLSGAALLKDMSLHESGEEAEWRN